MIRSVKRGLVLHFLFFKNEIRDFDAIAKGKNVKIPSEQLELGRGSIDKMSSADFEPERYADEYRERALAMIEKKVKGQEIKVVPPGATPHRLSRRYLRGIKEEPGNRQPAKSHPGASQAQKKSVGT